MKVKTSITLSEDLLEAMDRLLGEFKNRSALIEQAVRSFLQRRVRASREKKDLQILNDTAEALNAESGDVLSYQVEL